MRLDRWTSRARSGCALFLLLPVWLPAQRPNPTGLERRARVTWRDSAATHRETGVATWSSDTLRLRTTQGRAVPLPLASISRLELSTGRRGHVVKGSVIGFAVGAVLGAVSGASSTTPCRTNAGAPCASDATSRSSSIFAASSFLGVSGAMVGGGIGAFVRTDRWVDSTTLVRR